MHLVFLAPLGSVFALCFALYCALAVLKKDPGTPAMQAIAKAIREGANAYLKRQYLTLCIFFACVFGILWIFVYRGYLDFFVPFAFLTGGFFSGLAGFLGMKIATYANSRTTMGCTKSLNSGLRVAFSSGAIMGLTVVGLGLLDLSIWFFVLDWYYSNKVVIDDVALKMQKITSTMLTFGMGASSMALFARVGGGIFTKAADVGADLVGKVEENIPEDDPRNAGVIADNVGDNVGDVAGMGADLYESYVGSIVATMALGVSAFGQLGLALESLTIPMILAAVGVVSSIVGTFLVRAKEKAEQSELLRAIRRGIFTSAGLIFVLSFFIVRATLGMEHIGVYFSVVSGLVAGIFIGLSTEFFTSDKYPPTKNLSESALTGPATFVINGIATGMYSTSIPVFMVSAAILASYYFAGGAQNFSMGLYGVGISAVGMLSTLGITLATDAYGPVADNAGGIAEMSGQKPIVRKRTDALDSLGNTTAATGKGFAIGSAALTALALLAAYRTEVARFLGEAVSQLDLTILNPRIIVGLFIGGMLPFLFCALIILAVGRTASKIVQEIRRQFREIRGLLQGKAKADYARCVDICTTSAQREMILPSLLAIIAPLVMGILIGPEGVIALLAGALICGFALALFMANSGGAWDNAKKYIEAGHYGGKGSAAHHAGVIGDTVGDPFKDAAGPALNILIKLMSMVSLVFANFIVANALFK